MDATTAELVKGAASGNPLMIGLLIAGLVFLAIQSVVAVSDKILSIRQRREDGDEGSGLLARLRKVSQKLDGLMESQIKTAATVNESGHTLGHVVVAVEHLRNNLDNLDKQIRAQMNENEKQMALARQQLDALLATNLSRES